MFFKTLPLITVLVAVNWPTVLTGKEWSDPVIDEPCIFEGLVALCYSKDLWSYNGKTCTNGTCHKPQRKNLYNSYKSCAETCENGISPNRSEDETNTEDDNYQTDSKETFAVFLEVFLAITLTIDYFMYIVM